MNIDEFVASMEVQVNLMEEEKHERYIYERGVIAMFLSGNEESN
jgi:hypothetical protein